MMVNLLFAADVLMVVDAKENIRKIRVNWWHHHTLYRALSAPVFNLVKIVTSLNGRHLIVWKIFVLILTSDVLWRVILPDLLQELIGGGIVRLRMELMNFELVTAVEVVSLGSHCRRHLVFLVVS